MRLQRFITQVLALSLAIFTLGATAPVSAAEIVAPANIGAVSAVGSVQLRGIGISEGTLFSGDRLNVAQGGYARVVLAAGSKIEVDGSSDVTFSRDKDAVNVQMTSGNIAFAGTAQKPVHVRIGTYEITTAGQSRGGVGYVGSGAFVVRVLEGNVNVRNTATKQSYNVGKGNERLISLGTGNSGQSGVLLASNAPAPIPALPTPPRAGLSGGAKTAVIVAAVLGSAATIAVLTTKNDDTDSEAAARLRKSTGAQTLSNVSATATKAAAAANDVATASAAASTAINAAAVSATFTQAEKTALVNRANTLTSNATASKNQILTLQLQLANLQDQLANASPSTVSSLETQIAQVLSNVNSEVTKLNQYITDLNNLVNDARAEVPNILPIPTIQPVPLAQPASASNP